MDEKVYWNRTWRKYAKVNPPATNFARRSFCMIKGKRFKTVLDIGCGNGRDSLYFARKGLHVTAVDISEEALELCRKRNRHGKKVEPHVFERAYGVRNFFDKGYMQGKLKKFKILKIRKTASIHWRYKSSFVEAVARK